MLFPVLLLCHAEEDQRKLPCHQKEKSPEYGPWKTKLFHPEKVENILTGELEEFWIFGDGKPGEEAPERCLVQVSQCCPDVRTPSFKPKPRKKKIVKKIVKRKKRGGKSGEATPTSTDADEEEVEVETEEEEGATPRAGGGGGGDN